MRVKLKQLVAGTSFTIEGRVFKKTEIFNRNRKVGTVTCSPLLGGKFQDDSGLLEDFPEDLEVEVDTLCKSEIW